MNSNDILGSVSLKNETQSKRGIVKGEPCFFDNHQVRCVVIQPSKHLADIIESAALKAGLDVVGVCTEASEAIRLMMHNKPDVALVHGMFPNLTCQTIIKRLDSVIMTKYPAIIFNMPTLAAKLSDTKDSCFVMPYDPRDLRRLVSEALPLPARKDIIERARALLKRIGIPERPALEYLAYASALVFNNAMDVRRMSKFICPTIAAKHNTNARAVTEAMRRAIDTAWTKGCIDKQYGYFKNTINPDKGKPTCIEMIAMAAEIMRCGDDLR